MALHPYSPFLTNPHLRPKVTPASELRGRKGNIHKFRNTDGQLIQHPAQENNMQGTIKAKSAWASLLKPDFTPDTSSTLFTSQIDVENGKKSFAIDPVQISDDKKKWSSTIVGQVMGNNASYFNMKAFAEQRWTSKGLLEVQKMEESLFIFRFQSDSSKQEVLEQSPIPFGNRVLFPWPWDLSKPVRRLELNAVPVWVQLPN